MCSSDLLSDMMKGRGSVWASDISESRLHQLRKRAARAKVFNYRVAAWKSDALPTETKFDGVLVDAPCTGVGTWHRYPHPRWTVKPVDVEELSALQLRILNRVVPAIKPGGRLVYSVCTMTRDETVRVAERFTAAHPEFTPEPIANPLGSSADPKLSATWTFWPQDHAGNGMFVASWRKA